MYLPPYSPDYNRIEHDFATLKRSREYNPDKPLEDIIQIISLAIILKLYPNIRQTGIGTSAMWPVGASCPVS